MKTFLVTLLLALVAVNAFSPAFVGRTTSELGIFGGKKAPKKAAGGKNMDTFGGKAPRITVREDEDAAMWVEEPDDKKKKPTKKGK